MIYGKYAAQSWFRLIFMTWKNQLDYIFPNYVAYMLQNMCTHRRPQCNEVNFSFLVWYNFWSDLRKL